MFNYFRKWNKKFHNCGRYPAEAMPHLGSKAMEGVMMEIVTHNLNSSKVKCGDELADWMDVSELEMYLNDVLTVPASLAGLPAISVSAGNNNNNLPIGMQIIGRPFEEISVLAAGSVIELSKV